MGTGMPPHRVEDSAACLSQGTTAWFSCHSVWSSLKGEINTEVSAGSFITFPWISQSPKSCLAQDSSRLQIKPRVGQGMP